MFLPIERNDRLLPVECRVPAAEALVLPHPVGPRPTRIAGAVTGRGSFPAMSMGKLVEPDAEKQPVIRKSGTSIGQHVDRVERARTGTGRARGEPAMPSDERDEHRPPTGAGRQPESRHETHQVHDVPPFYDVTSMLRVGVFFCILHVTSFVTKQYSQECPLRNVELESR